MIGDPQTRGLKTDKAVERFDDQIIKDLKDFNHKTDKEVYAICLGDLVYNYMTSYDDYLDVLAKSPVPMVSVIGNHDYDQRTLFETDLGLRQQSAPASLSRSPLPRSRPTALQWAQKAGR